MEDPFYNDYNQERLNNSIGKAERGEYTLHELVEEMDEEIMIVACRTLYGDK